MLFEFTIQPRHQECLQGCDSQQTEGEDTKYAVEGDSTSQVRVRVVVARQERRAQDADDGEWEQSNEKVGQRLGQTGQQYCQHHYPAEQRGNTEEAEVIAGRGLDEQDGIGQVGQQGRTGQQQNQRCGALGGSASLNGTGQQSQLQPCARCVQHCRDQTCNYRNHRGSLSQLGGAMKSMEPGGLGIESRATDDRWISPHV